MEKIYRNVDKQSRASAYGIAREIVKVSNAMYVL